MARKLAVNVTALNEDGEYTTFLAGTEVSAKVAKGIDNPKAWGGVDETADEPITGDYGDRKAAELQAEVDRRNATRPEADGIEVDGKTKAALVAALEADDTASA